MGAAVGGSRLYIYYDVNFGEFADTINEGITAAEDLKELERLNRENAAKTLDVLGNSQFSHTMGSFDAIGELNMKMDKSIGPATTAIDMANELT